MTLFVLIPITALFVVAMIVGRNELVKRKLACPRKGMMADVDVARRYFNPTKLMRIMRCSLLTNPKKIDCEQECLKTGARHP